MKITDAIKDNTAARQELAESIRAIDWNGHVPDEPSAAAADLLEVMEETRESVYQLAEAFGISRAELNGVSGVEAA